MVKSDQTLPERSQIFGIYTNMLWRCVVFAHET